MYSDLSDDVPLTFTQTASNTFNSIAALGFITCITGHGAILELISKNIA